MLVQEANNCFANPVCTISIDIHIAFQSQAQFIKSIKMMHIMQNALSKTYCHSESVWQNSWKVDEDIYVPAFFSILSVSKANSFDLAMTKINQKLIIDQWKKSLCVGNTSSDWIEVNWIGLKWLKWLGCNQICCTDIQHWYRYYCSCSKDISWSQGGKFKEQK